MYGDFPAKNTVYTPYVPMNVWFWPTLLTMHALASLMRTTAPLFCYRHLRMFSSLWIVQASLTMHALASLMRTTAQAALATWLCGLVRALGTPCVCTNVYCLCMHLRVGALECVCMYVCVYVHAHMCVYWVHVLVQCTFDAYTTVTSCLVLMPGQTLRHTSRGVHKTNNMQA
jgi:hypothetical protein